MLNAQTALQTEAIFLIRAVEHYIVNFLPYENKYSKDT